MPASINGEVEKRKKKEGEVGGIEMQNMLKKKREVVRKINEKFVETKWGKVGYWQQGQGKNTLVFIHGFLGSPRHGRMLADKFSREGWQVILPYLPGHGGSFTLPRNYSFPDLVATMEEFVAKVTRGEIILAGHSLGGAVAWEVACCQPNRVKKLILIDPGLQISKRVWLTGGVQMLVNHFIFDRLAAGRVIPTVNPFRVLGLVKNLCVSALPQEMPVLLMVGDKDRITPLQEYEDKLRGLKRLTLKIFPGGHHWYQWQEDKFLEEISRFLRLPAN